MKKTILNLKKEVEFIETISDFQDRTNLEHGSESQTRSMLFESMFEIAINNLKFSIMETITKKSVIAFYLEFINNFLTIEKMAEYYEMPKEDCEYLIKLGGKYELEKWSK